VLGRGTAGHLHLEILFLRREEPLGQKQGCLNGPLFPVEEATTEVLGVLAEKQEVPAALAPQAETVEVLEAVLQEEIVLTMQAQEEAQVGFRLVQVLRIHRLRQAVADMAQVVLAGVGVVPGLILR